LSLLASRGSGNSNVVNQPQQFRDLVMQQTVIQPSETVTISPLHQIPQPPLDFTGRQQELDELLAASERGSIISGLQGQGGVGKTALALELAKKLKPAYPDAQFYLDLRGVNERPLAPAEAMAHVIRSYHPTIRLPESEAELRPLFLSALHGQRALLLMDNARDRQQVEPLIPPEGCALLVTSRQHFTLPGLFAKRLDTLPPEDARELLLKIAPRTGAHADEIARLCGYLPMALRLAGGALAERVNLLPDDYARRLTNAQQRFAPVDASLNLSYELLGDERRRQWRLLAVFPATFDEAAVAAVWETNVEAARDAIGELVAYSLVEWEEEARRYRLHDLSRLFADAGMSDDERETASRRHALYFLSVLEQANNLYKQGGEAVVGGLALYDRERANIKAGQTWAEARTGQDERAAELCIEYPDAGAYVLDLRQHPRERIHWLEVMLAAARKLKWRGDEGTALGNLGIAYNDLGETRRAIEFHEQALVIEREIGYRRGEGTALGSLGIAYKNLGETRRAIEFYEQYLAIAREIGDRSGEGIALGNLGNAYAILGETRRAIEFYEQALVIVCEIGDRRGEGTDLWNLSLAVDELGDREKAIALAEASLKIREEIEDPNASKVREQLAYWRGQAGTE
jgi:tetratricopeptide (TPR) repeat protein